MWAPGTKARDGPGGPPPKPPKPCSFLFGGTWLRSLVGTYLGCQNDESIGFWNRFLKSFLVCFDVEPAVFGLGSVEPGSHPHRDTENKQQAGSTVEGLGAGSG